MGAARLTPMKAIRLKCLDCCCGATKEVRECLSHACPLWLFRMKHRPKQAEVEKWVKEFGALHPMGNWGGNDTAEPSEPEVEGDDSEGRDDDQEESLFEE